MNILCVWMSFDQQKQALLGIAKTLPSLLTFHGSPLEFFLCFRRFEINGLAQQQFPIVCSLTLRRSVCQNHSRRQTGRFERLLIFILLQLLSSLYPDSQITPFKEKKERKRRSFCSCPTMHDSTCSAAAIHANYPINFP